MHRLAAATLLTATATLASGQDSAPAPAPGNGPQTQPVFESGAELVRLDLVVRDAKGRFVRDLREDEIQVFEDGQPVSLTSLRLVDADASGGLRARTAPAPEAGTEAGSTDTPVQVAQAPELASVVVLLFDSLQGRSAQAAQKAALQFIHRSFPERTWFGVFKATRTGLVTLHRFTEDSSSLERAVRAATRGADVRYDQTVDISGDTRAEGRPPGSRSGSDAAAAEMEGVEEQISRFESLLMREERGRNSLYPLLTLARALRGVPGRKTLLHFSQGLDVTPDIEQLLLSAIGEANRSNLAIYTFDARGLFQESPFAGARSALESTIPAEAFMGPAELAAMQQGGGGTPVSRGEVFRMDTALDALRMNVQENLRELAESTSGFLVANSNDLRPGLDLVSRDLRTYYEIAYAPPNPVVDGTFREITVRVARADAHVRVRKGYYALPPGVPVIHPWELSLAQALEAPTLPRGLAVRAGAVRLAPEARASRTVVLAEVPLGELETRVDPDTGLWSAHVSMLAFVKDERDRVIARLGQDWPLRGQGPPSGLVGRTVMLERTLDLAPGRYSLEAVAEDRLGGRLGARRVPFVVPEATDGPAVGSVSVVRFQPASPDGQDPQDPLLIREREWEKAAVRALPVLGAPLPVEAGQIGLLASLRPQRDGGPVSVTVEFWRDGEILAESSPEVPDPDAAGQILLARSFALPSIEPGRYQVYVRMRQRDKEASAGTSFRLERADPFGLLPAS